MVFTEGVPLLPVHVLQQVNSLDGLQSPQASPRGQIPIASAASPPPTSRDFVPWRFSDAGRHSPWMTSSCRRPRNLHSKRLLHRINDKRLFDHLVGAEQQRCRHFDADRLRGLQVDHHLKPCG
jgi:hypothetical protein